MNRKVHQQFLLSTFVQTQDVDAADVKLLALIEVDIKGDQRGFIVKLGIRDSVKVDVAKFFVGFTEILQSLRDLLTAEDVTVFDWEKPAQSFEVANRLVVLERDLAQAVLWALVDMNAKREALADGVAGQYPWLAANLHFKVPLVLPRQLSLFPGLHSLRHRERFRGFAA